MSSLGIEINRHPFMFPGGYTRIGLTSNCDVVCYTCCRERRKDIESEFTHWEGEAIQCSHCNRWILAEYGEDGEYKDDVEYE